MGSIIQGDCYEVIKTIPDNSVDLVIIDPPYKLNTGAEHSRTGFQSLHTVRRGLNQIKEGFDVATIFEEYRRVLKKFNLFCFCSNKQITEIMSWGESNGFYTTLLVWHKTNAPPFANGVYKSDLEFIVHIREKGATFVGGAKLKSKLYQSTMVKTKYHHPTEKPIELLSKFVQIASKEGDIILDSFAGSGTTAIACLQNNRNYILIEKESEYIDMAERRILDHCNSLQPLF